MFKLKVILVSTLALLLLIVVVQNSEVVTVNLLLWKFQMSRVVLILLAATVGFSCGYLAARLGGTRARAHDGM